MISWNSSEPLGSSIDVRARTSNDRISWTDWEETESGAPLTELADGRYIEVEAAFSIQAGEVSPVLYDLTVFPAANPRANTAPSFTSTPVVGAEEGVFYLYQARAEEYENDRLTYSLDYAPDGMAIDSFTGLVTWTPDALQAGDHAVTVRAADSEGAFALQHYTVTAAEALACIDGDERACGISIGVCEKGVQTCASGEWGACEGAIDPAPELCDGLDNNCNGAVDDDPAAPLADIQLGVCADSLKVCAGADGWMEPDYSEMPGYESPEATLDGLDNDCDDEIDVIPTAVPDVVGLLQADAEAAIDAARLTTGAVTRQYSDTVPEGHVISQAPARGRIVQIETPVNIVVSLGIRYVTVPDVTGMTRTDAEAAIASAGLAPGAVTGDYIDLYPAEQVFLQNPSPGESVVHDTPLDISVSLGIWTGVDETPPVVQVSYAPAEVKLPALRPAWPFPSGSTSPKL